MKSPAERGPIGAWAFQSRQEKGLSVEQVADALTALGQSTRPSTLRGIESGGKKPSAHLLALLGEVLESVPPEVTAPGADSAIIEAIDRQTAVLDRIANLLERLDQPTLRPAGPTDALRVAQARRQAEADLDAYEESMSSRSNENHPGRGG